MSETRNRQRFDNKVVLITGGSSGIGRAAALAFAREGARLVIASRGRERGEAVARELGELGAEARFIPTDVGVSDQVASLVEETVAEFGRLDCALNNAATLEVDSFRSTAELDEATFDRDVARNLKSVWVSMKHELAQMLHQEGGAIVNTSSVNGLGGVPGNAAYAMAKAGVLALTKSAALEHATDGIRINALVAGAFRTPMLETAIELASPDDPSAAEEQYLGAIPMRRIGSPEEAAEAVLWLCSEEASYVTGHGLIVDGGMSAPYR